jgi:hypothetical protein
MAKHVRQTGVTGGRTFGPASDAIRAHVDIKKSNLLEDLINFGRHGEARTTNRRDRRKNLWTRERRDQGSSRIKKKQPLGKPDRLRSASRSAYDKPA